jgi:hypothetical protein
VLLSPLDKAAEYRRRAQEAREQANFAWNQATQDELLNLAAHLVVLAEIEETKALQIAPIGLGSRSDRQTLQHVRDILAQLRLRK